MNYRIILLVFAAISLAVISLGSTNSNYTDTFIVSNNAYTSGLWDAPLMPIVFVPTIESVNIDQKPTNLIEPAVNNIVLPIEILILKTETPEVVIEPIEIPNVNIPDGTPAPNPDTTAPDLQLLTDSQGNDQPDNIVPIIDN